MKVTSRRCRRGTETSLWCTCHLRWYPAVGATDRRTIGLDSTGELDCASQTLRPKAAETSVGTCSTLGYKVSINAIPSKMHASSSPIATPHSTPSEGSPTQDSHAHASHLHLPSSLRLVIPGAPKRCGSFPSTPSPPGDADHGDSCCLTKTLQRATTCLPFAEGWRTAGHGHGAFRVLTFSGKEGPMTPSTPTSARRASRSLFNVTAGSDDSQDGTLTQEPGEEEEHKDNSQASEM
ncbi:hypothetical protein C8Q77DRAFT_300861 [Trametes polyzona]|nr:hypothetical protein C8Q77DRAFT_300861 [Trametes polyzona]